MKTSHIVGIVLILAGVLIPAGFLVELLRPLPQDATLANQLLRGALLFKAGLLVLGATLILLGSPRFQDRLRWIHNAKEIADETDSYKVWLWGLLLFSLVLRLYKLGEGLWLDEIAMAIKYLRRPFGELLTLYDSENQHLLYTILAYLSTSLFGENGWGLRLPAVLFGLGSIWALYHLGKEVTSRREALLGSALLSLSYYHVWFSQNARGYTGLLFWTLFTSWHFVRALSGGPTRYWIYYAIAVALGMFTQFMTIFVAAGHFLIYVPHAWRGKRFEVRWTGLLAGFVLAGILTFQLYALVIPQFLNTIGMKGTVDAWNSPLWTLTELIRGMKVSFHGGIAAVAALIVFASGFWSYARTKPILLALLILPPLLGTLVVISLGHPIWPRFYFFTFGFGALIVIRGAMVLGMILARLFQRPQRAETFGFVLCVCMILVSAFSIRSAYFPKQDFVGALRYINENRKVGDVVVTIGTIRYPYGKFYKTDFIEVTNVETLNRITEKARATWLLYMIPEDVRTVFPQIMSRVETNFQVVKRFPSPLADGTIYVCKNK